jgi:fibronectin type 3 domain-containing protein
VTFPFTIAAGATRSVTIQFAPQASGTVTGTASFVSNATNSPATVSLSGSGVAPIQHSVDLSWTASTSIVVGYNVYRGTQSGGPYTKINSSLNATTAYTDSTVQSGTTYYYVVTAVDATNAESAYSNQAVAVIPIP